MKRRRKTKSTAVEMQMGPMIDMVFLLLVFFMVTAKPLKPEADINLGLPGSVEQDEPLELPDEQKVVIQNSGAILLNDMQLAAATDHDLDKLFSTLFRLSSSAKAAKSDLLVTLAPEDATTHQRIVDVLNVCAKAGITGVTFDDPGGAEN